MGPLVPSRGVEAITDPTEPPADLLGGPPTVLNSSANAATRRCIRGAAARPPRTMGGCGRCSGLGRNSESSIGQCRPRNEKRSCANRLETTSTRPPESGRRLPGSSPARLGDGTSSARPWCRAGSARSGRRGRPGSSVRRWSPAPTPSPLGPRASRRTAWRLTADTGLASWHEATDPVRASSGGQGPRARRASRRAHRPPVPAIDLSGRGRGPPTLRRRLGGTHRRHRRSLRRDSCGTRGRSTGTVRLGPRGGRARPGRRASSSRGAG